MPLAETLGGNGFSQQAIRRWRSAWPAMLGMVCAVAGVVMLAGAAHFSSRAKALSASDVSARASSSPAASAPADPLSSILIPAFDSQLEDVHLLLSLAQRHAVGAPGITYRTEPLASTALATRILEVQLEHDYSRVKAFLADVLRKCPHAYLQQINVEASSTTPGRIRAMLRLVFVYRQEVEAR